MVAQDEIHAGVSQVETAGVLFAEGRHQQTGGAAGSFGHEAEGYGDG